MFDRLLLGLFPRRRRRRLLATPLTSEQREIVRRHLPAWEHLDEPLRRRLEGLVQVFLDEVDFEGCGGFVLTEEARVAIAARACLLVLGTDRESPFPELDVVLVYPSSWAATDVRRDAGGLVHQRTQRRLGESHARGQVVLSWSDVEAGARDPHDGHDVVLHELAHQLDQELPGSEGAPRLRRAADYAAWARVLGGAYETLADRVEHHRKTFLDAYGATSPAEFYAVATEAFFEKPKALRRRLPELYDELVAYHGLDPASWSED